MTLIRSLLTAHSATCAEWAVKRDLISVIRDLVKCQKCQKALPLARTWPLDTASLRADADFAVYLFFPFLFSPFSLLFFFASAQTLTPPQLLRRGSCSKTCFTWPVHILKSV